MQRLDNTEIMMMRVESDIGESRAEMCVDLNGFQVILTHWENVLSVNISFKTYM